MKFPVIIPNVIYTSFFEYVLSVMVTNSSSGGAEISSYLLQAMKEKKSNSESPCDNGKKNYTFSVENVMLIENVKLNAISTSVSKRQYSPRKITKYCTYDEISMQVTPSNWSLCLVITRQERNRSMRFTVR